MAAQNRPRKPRRVWPMLGALMIAPLIATGPMPPSREAQACQDDVSDLKPTPHPEQRIGGLKALPHGPKQRKTLSARLEEQAQKQSVHKEKQRLAMGWVRYKGRVVSPEDFRRRARSITGRQIAGMSHDLVGEAVEIVGTLEQKKRDQWTIMTVDQAGQSEGKVMIDAAQLRDSVYREGRSIRIWGIVQDEAMIEARFCDLLPPGVEWKYQLRDPGFIAGGKSQQFTVDCAAHNTGSQPLRRAVVTVRVYVPNSASQKTKTITIKDLAVGETRRFPVEVRLDMRAARIPKVEAAVLEYEF